MESVLETFERVIDQREAFIEGACTGEFPMKAKDAIEIARAKYPLPKITGEVPEVSVWSQREGKFVPYVR